MVTALNLPLKYEGREVRVVGTPDRPAWVAIDVCEALGMRNPHSSLALVPDDERVSTLWIPPAGGSPSSR